MYLLYSILLTLGVIVMLPRFVVDAFRHGKYVTGLRQRLGQVPVLSDVSCPVIWLHCVSVGETQAARTLFQSLKERFPHHSLVVSTTTLTGQRVARELFKEDALLVFYFPFDWAWTVRRSIDAIQPALVIIMETELWPNFLRESNRRNIPVAIANGRLSERSFRRFRFIPGFTSRMVSDIALALMQTEADAQRMRTLGMADERVRVTGNLKFDAGTSFSEQTLSNEFRHRFGISNKRPLIVAASTHEPEERIALDAVKLMSCHFGEQSPRVLIAPRHPERFSQIATLLQASGLTWSRRSAAPESTDATCDAILLDSIGELRAAYRIADIVFVGGSLAETGGHNVLEPIEAGKCVVTGADTHNFSEIIQTFVVANAIVQLPPISLEEAPHRLAKALTELLENDDERQALIGRATSLLEQNRGATGRTINAIERLLANASG